MAGGSSWNGVKGMKKLFCVLLVCVVMVSLLCVPAFAVNEAFYTYWCPNCKRHIGANDVQTNGFLNACPHCNCALSPREGSIFRGGGAGRLGSSSREYYTERSGGGGSFTPGSGAGRYDSGATSYYSLIDETTQSFQFLNQKFTYNTYVYDTDYNYYTVTIDDSENYYIYDYGTYYIINAPTDVTVEGVTQYEDVTIYYELPDGRSSADLKSPEDVYGTVFVYEVGNYEEVLEDDGTTLGLWHLDGNLLNSAARNDHPLTSIESVYDEGVFGDAIRLDNGMSNSYVGYEQNTFDPNDLAYMELPYDTDEPFTLEFWVYLSSLGRYFEGGSSQYLGMLPVAYTTNPLTYAAGRDSFVVPDKRWVSVAICYDGSGFSWFLNGVKQTSGTLCKNVPIGQGSFYFSNGLLVRYHNSNYLSDFTYQYVLYDEIRLSKGVLYTSNYTPRTEIFDTNLVMVPPQNPKENDLAIKSNVPVSDYRVGGVRPTYPTEGYVYVYLEENVIKDIQQFQNGNWVSVEGSIYKNGEWVDAKNYDLSGITLEPPDEGEGEGGEGGEGEGGEGSDNPEDSSFWDKVFGTLGGALSTIFKAVATLFASLVEGVATLVTSILGVFTDFSGLAAGFSSFLAEVFPFLPPEITSLLVLAISLSIAMAVIRFLKG